MCQKAYTSQGSLDRHRAYNKMICGNRRSVHREKSRAIPVDASSTDIIKHSKGASLTPDIKAVISNVHLKIEEHFPPTTKGDVYEKTAEFTGIGLRSVMKVVQERQTGQFRDNTPCRRPKKSVYDKMSDEQRALMREAVHDKYEQVRLSGGNEPYPTLESINAFLCKVPGLPKMSDATLDYVLLRLGFR